MMVEHVPEIPLNFLQRLAGSLWAFPRVAVAGVSSVPFLDECVDLDLQNGFAPLHYGFRTERVCTLGAA